MAIGVVGAGMALSLPSIGLGTSRNDDPKGRAATVAPETGYRRVDTAQMYGNEAAVAERTDRERRLLDPEDGP